MKFPKKLDFFSVAVLLAATLFLWFFVKNRGKTILEKALDKIEEKMLCMIKNRLKM